MRIAALRCLETPAARRRCASGVAVGSAPASRIALILPAQRQRTSVGSRAAAPTSVGKACVAIDALRHCDLRTACAANVSRYTGRHRTHRLRGSNGHDSRRPDFDPCAIWRGYRSDWSRDAQPTLRKASDVPTDTLCVWCHKARQLSHRLRPDRGRGQPEPTTSLARLNEVFSRERPGSSEIQNEGINMRTDRLHYIRCQTWRFAWST